jgi:hypothetical protein
LPSIFVDASLDRPHTNIVRSVNLTQSLQFRLGGDQLTFQICRRAHHRAALLFNVDCRVLACKLAEIFFCRFQTLLNLAESCL